MKAVEIPLTREQVALVDADDAEVVNAAGSWYANWTGAKFYASKTVVTPRKGLIRMHTFLTGWPLVDHINGDTLDNRRSNLRPATVSQNIANSKLSARNKSGYKGVNFFTQTGRWRAYIGGNATRVDLGYFDTAEEAALAYDAAARERWGQFARTNFPDRSALDRIMRDEREDREEAS